MSSTFADGPPLLAILCYSLQVEGPVQSDETHLNSIEGLQNRAIISNLQTKKAVWWISRLNHYTVLFRPSVHVTGHKPLWTEHLGKCHKSHPGVNTGWKKNIISKKFSTRGPLKIEWTLTLMNTFFFHVTGHSMQWTPLPVNTKGHMSQAMNSWSK